MPNREKRDLILQAALQNFIEVGYERATMQNIAREAGVGKGTTYEYFENKEALLCEVLLTGITKVIDELKAELEKNGTVEDKVRRLYTKNLQLFRSESALKEIMINNIGKIPKDLHEKIQIKHKEILKTMEAVLQEGIDKAEIASVHPRVAASVILHGLQVIYCYEPLEHEQLENVLEEQLIIVFNGIKKG